MSDRTAFLVYHDVTGPRALLVPCVPLAALAAWLAARGLDQLWLAETGQPADPVAVLVVAMALHAAWILPAASRAHSLLVSLAWLVSLSMCRAGFIASGSSRGLVPAAVVETLVLALALSGGEHALWADRLARWRRARCDITTQLRMSDGLAPWLIASVRRLLTGTPDRPASAAFDRLAADLADAEHRLKTRITAMALPEDVRQAVLSSAGALASRAELATAHASMVLERQALEEAAACRDRIAQLVEVPEAKREGLARECERLLLDLVQHAGTGRLAALVSMPRVPRADSALKV